MSNYLGHPTGSAPVLWVYDGAQWNLMLTSSLVTQGTGGGTNYITGSGWLTAYDKDFATLTTSSFTLTGSGPDAVLIDGYVWNLENQTRAQTVGILPGTGLVFQLNSNTSDYEGSTRNLPLLTTALQNFIPAYNLFTDDVRIWIRLELTGATNGGNNAVFGFDKTTPYDNNKRAAFLGLKGLNSSLSWYLKNRYGSSQDNIGGSGVVYKTSSDVMLLKTSGRRTWEAWLGTFNTGSNTWPLETELHPFSVSHTAGGSAFLSNVSDSVVTYMTASSDAAFMLGCQAGGTGTSGFTSTFKRIRIDYIRTSNAGGGSSTAASTVSGTWRDPGNTFVTTSSVSIDSQNRTTTQVGSDTFFFVSGTIAGPATGKNISVFGGDTVTSGSGAFLSGLSGSLQQLTTGLSYLVAGTHVTIASQSNGQVVINSEGGGSTGFQSPGYVLANYAFATSSVEWTVPASASFIGVPSLTASVTTTGSPVLILVNGDITALSAGAAAAFSISRNGVNLGHASYGITVLGPTVVSYDQNIGMFFADTVPAGTYTYSVIATALTGTNKLTHNGVGPASLTVFEMKNALVVSASMSSSYLIPGAGYAGVPGLSASIVPVKNAVLLLAQMNYQSTAGGNWASTTFFKGGVNQSAASSPTGFNLVVGTAAGQSLNFNTMYLDQTPTLGATNTYDVRTLNGAGSGRVSGQGQTSQLIVWELTDVNWRFVHHSTAVTPAAFSSILSTPGPQTIATRGRPVVMIGSMQSNTAGTTGRAGWSFERNGSNLGSTKGFVITDGENTTDWNRSATLSWLDEVPVGAYSYDFVGTQVSGSNSTNQGSETCFLVYELDPGNTQAYVGGWIDGGHKLTTTSSVSIDSRDRFATDNGLDNYFYVSGTIGLEGASARKSVFGGDVRISGSITVGSGSITITSNDVQFGSVSVRIERSGTQLKFFDESNTGGRTLSDMYVTSSVGAYSGWCSGSLLWSATTWTDFVSVPGNFTDTIQQNIIRSGSTFTVNQTGFYQFYSYFEGQTGTGGTYIGFRLSGSNGTLLQHTVWQVANATQAPVLQGIVQVNSGSSFKLQYATKSVNTAEVTFNVNDPIDGENMRTGNVSINFIR